MNTQQNRELDGNYQRAVGDMIDREVSYCASYLVSELASNEKYMDDLYPILSQPDYESAAYDEGWTEQFTDDYGVNCYRNTDGMTWAAPDYESLCDSFEIEPYDREALEHWIVSDWLAGKLEEQGEMIIRDFLGLTIWGRSCSGQAVLLDSVICRIYNDLHGIAA